MDLSDVGSRNVLLVVLCTGSHLPGSETLSRVAREYPTVDFSPLLVSSGLDCFPRNEKHHCHCGLLCSFLLCEFVCFPGSFHSREGVDLGNTRRGCERIEERRNGLHSKIGRESSVPACPDFVSGMFHHFFWNGVFLCLAGASLWNCRDGYPRGLASH